MLLDALSWLPERVAVAARHGQPDEFARYLEELASATVAALICVGYPANARVPGTDRLSMAKAARTGLAAGLGLSGSARPTGCEVETLRMGNRSESCRPPGRAEARGRAPADHPPAPPADVNAIDAAIWPRGAQRQGGVLTLGGIDVRDLAARFGTPVLVTDEADVRAGPASTRRRSARTRTSPTRPRRSARGRCCAG